MGCENYKAGVGIESLNVLSLFDGMSCGQIALERAGFIVGNYFASEVDKYAMQVTKHNYPNTQHIGDVRKVEASSLPIIDVLIGGSPCQSFSFAGKRKGMATKDSIEIIALEQYLKLKADGFEFEGQSYLFWEYIRLLEEVEPKYFLLENVLMDKRWERIITNTLGVQPIMINSSLVSAQNRKRLYWTNIPNIKQPIDKGLLLKDIIQDGDADRDKSLAVTTRVGGATEDRYLNKSMHQMIKVGNVNPSGNGMNGNVFSTEGKCPTLTTNKGEGIKITGGAQRGRYLINGKRADTSVESMAGLTEQRIEIRDDGKSNCLTTVQKDSLLVQLQTINPRVKGISYNDNGIRVHQGDTRKSGISELGTLYFDDSKSGTLIASQVPNVVIKDKSSTICANIYKENPKSMLQRNKMGLLVGTKDSQCIQVGVWDTKVNTFDENKRIYSVDGKSPTIKAAGGGYHERKIAVDDIHWRKLTPIECARLQTVPDLYCSVVSNSQQYKLLGNGWTVDVIAHMFSYMQGFPEPLKRYVVANEATISKIQEELF